MSAESVRIWLAEHAPDLQLIETEESTATVAEAAAALDVATEDEEAAYRRLEQAHVIVLAPGTTNVWMAAPLSAVPTPFRVVTGTRSYWGNCVWDALGIPAMLGADARVETWCADCGQRIELVVEDEALRPAEGVAHFSVPAAR